MKATLPRQEDFWVVAANGDKRDFRKVTLHVLSSADRLCSQGPVVAVTATLQDGSPDVYTFQADAVRGLQPPLRVTWSFGDGTREESGAVTKHSYATRPQSSPASSFIVTAEVTDARGRWARSRVSVSLQNTYYHARAFTADRPLPVAYDRFPAHDDRTLFSANITNIEDHTVLLDRAVVRVRPCDASGAATEHLVDVSELLSESELPAGETSTTHITLHPGWVSRNICQVDVTLLGDTDPPSTGEPMAINGIPQKDVTVEMSFQLGMPETLEQGGHPDMAAHEIKDPELVKRLVAIMSARGTNHLSGEEVNAAMKQGPLEEGLLVASFAPVSNCVKPFSGVHVMKRSIEARHVYLCLSALLTIGSGCGSDSSSDPNPVGTHTGRTRIALFRSVSDSSPYEQEREDSVTVRSSGSSYQFNWLGCEFEVPKEGPAAGDLEPTTCELELEDGRKATLVIGPLVDPHKGEGSTLTNFFFDGDYLTIDVVAALTIDNVYYRPSYFRFTGYPKE